MWFPLSALIKLLIEVLPKVASSEASYMHGRIVERADALKSEVQQSREWAKALLAAWLSSSQYASTA